MGDTTTTRTERRIYTCKLCKWIRTVDHTIVTTYLIDARGYRHALGRVIDGVRESRPNQSLIPMCPQCKAYTQFKAVKGQVGERICDYRCTSATGPDCVCSCGGANHGAQHIA